MIAEEDEAILCRAETGGDSQEFGDGSNIDRWEHRVAHILVPLSFNAFQSCLEFPFVFHIEYLVLHRSALSVNTIFKEANIFSLSR